MPRPYLSVVAPCFNEDEVLPAFHRRVSTVCRRLGVPYELVLVNDGSGDRTWETLLELSSADPNLVCVNLARNHGHQLALTAGLSLCRGERVLILDADLQDPPELLPEMLRVMDTGADVVYGRRRRRKGESACKRLTAALFYRLLSRLTDVAIPQDTGDFRLISRRVLDVLLAMPERHRFLRGMVSWVGYRQEALPYDRDPRYAGETKYPYRKLWKLALDGVTAFSVKPRALGGLLGAATVLLALLLGVGALAGWVAGSASCGWLGLLAGVAMLSGVQLLFLGVIGAYLGRLYEQSQGRPLFLIDRVVRAEQPAESKTRNRRSVRSRPSAIPSHITRSSAHG
jgi:dolichol-phosphate mannosyltransferase